MTLCEHLQCLDAAAKFAQAAAQEITRLKESAPAEYQEDLLAREGRVWANLFTYAVYSRQYQVRILQLCYSICIFLVMNGRQDHRLILQDEDLKLESVLFARSMRCPAFHCNN